MKLSYTRKKEKKYIEYSNDLQFGSFSLKQRPSFTLRKRGKKKKKYKKKGTKEK